MNAIQKQDIKTTPELAPSALASEHLRKEARKKVAKLAKRNPRLLRDFEKLASSQIVRTF